MSIRRISVTGLIKNPKFSGIYKDYKKLSVKQYNNLIAYLYSGSLEGWENPLTDKDLNRSSKIIISFLSYCYYILDDGSKVDISGHRLSYREHILQFIDEVYLYEKDRVSISAATQLAQTNTQTRGTPALPLPPLPPLPPSPQAARGSPRGLSAAAIAAAHNNSSSSSVKMSYSPPTINKTAQSMQTLSVAANKLTENKCLDFVEEIKILKKGKTKEEIKSLRIKSPVTGAMIGFKSPIFQSFLFKCYSFDNDKLKKAIRKVVSKDFLENIKEKIDIIDKNKRDQQALIDAKKAADEAAREAARQAAREAAKEAAKKEREEFIEKIPDINKYIEDLLGEFHICCDELKANCNGGVLNSYKYISNVINAIVTIIFTKYLHLHYYYDDLYNNTRYDKPLNITLIMYDDKFKEFYESKSENPIIKITDAAYRREIVIYQKDDLTQDVTKELIDNIPQNNIKYQQNSLFNRQYVFDIFRDDRYVMGFKDKNYVNLELVYNKVNHLNMNRIPTPFNSLKFPDTMGYAKKLFAQSPFNYNLTNGVLPRYIFIATTDQKLSFHSPFSELIGEINEKLQELPNIVGIKSEATTKRDYYNNILEEMMDAGYGSDDIIRKNILYSLNAQHSAYVRNSRGNHAKDIFYNNEYTGMFPIFTWIPTNVLAYYNTWQPYGFDKNHKFRLLGDAYKNYGVAPWSKTLNDAIYKVIVKQFNSIRSFPTIAEYEKDRLIKRVNETLGVYMKMNIDSAYNNSKIYLYHGTNSRLHTMKDRDNDIEILGFLSTSLNVYIASSYTGAGTTGHGYIYLIEADDKQGYINLDDMLYQFILLPHSIIRIVYEFNIGGITIILCKLIMTPTKEQNIYLYNSLLNIPQAVTGGINSMKQIEDAIIGSKARAKAAHTAHTAHSTIIEPEPNMCKIKDLNTDILKYYGLTLTDKNKNDKIDISNGCYVRLVNKKAVDKMIADRV